MARDIDLGPTPSTVGVVRRRAVPEKMAIKRNPPEARVDPRTTDTDDWWVGVRAHMIARRGRDDGLVWSVGIARDGLFLPYRSRKDPNRAVGAAILLAMMLGRPCLYVVAGGSDGHYRTDGEGDELRLYMETQHDDLDDVWIDMESMGDFVRAEACPTDGAVRLVLAEDMRWHRAHVTQVEAALREMLGTLPDSEV